MKHYRLRNDQFVRIETLLPDRPGHFGRDSAEYGQAGGTRKSDIKRPARKAAENIKKLAA